MKNGRKKRLLDTKQTGSHEWNGRCTSGLHDLLMVECSHRISIIDHPRHLIYGVEGTGKLSYLDYVYKIPKGLKETS